MTSTCTPFWHREWSIFPRNKTKIDSKNKIYSKIEGEKGHEKDIPAEKKVKAMDGVKDATVSFFAQKLVLEADDGRFDEIARKVAEVVHHTDADCTMVL